MKVDFALIPSNEETETTTIEKTFDDFTQRKDIAILLINQHVLPRRNGVDK
jgi:vacuolar-type H+-ATPase subunit F/Vma7